MLRYVALFKPYGVLSSFTHEGVSPTDAGKRTLSEFGLPPHVYAAGRLDYDSEGLLILSDDGLFIHRLTDPRYKLPKTYWAQVEGEPTESQLAHLRHGVIVRGYRTRPCQARLLLDGIAPAQSNGPFPQLPWPIPARDKPVTPHGPTAWIELILTEGKKRQVRHMTAAVGLPTVRLIRVAIGPLTLQGLQPGRWRDLSLAERQALMAHQRTTSGRKNRRMAGETHTAL
ncbi:MAG: pseudouridine synthase [Anaerolineae bacterium]|nr:pseudouridine synthase [Thermoflexales bacterium]MDW8406153.1 pseudouridine synthase [Anaerolineae bacterium]